MRTRLALLLALVLGFSALAIPAFAADVVLAQEEQPGDEGVGEEEESTGGAEQGTTEDEGGGQDEPEAETGAGEGETEEAAEETGPVWTYQMSKIVIVMLLLLGLGIAGAYYNFVHKRAKEGI